MNSNCQHQCSDRWVFPKRPSSRPGLDQINYRIATYADFKEQMIRQLNQNAALQAWTYREADDPGIALLEGAAMLGDILTFYQNHYANEAFLRTAQWKESIAELVRLLGYRLSPGLGGEGTFAVEVSGTSSVTIPSGLCMKAQLDGMDKPSEFESIEESIAHPGLSKFKLYHPYENENISDETKEYFIDYIHSDADDVEIDTGDRFIVGEMAHHDNGTYLRHSELAVVESVRELHGHKIFKIKGALLNTTDASRHAFKILRSFKHYGAESANRVVTLPADLSNGATSEPANFIRHINMNTTDGIDPELESRDLPINEEVEDLTQGTQIAYSARFSGQRIEGATESLLTDFQSDEYAVIRTIESVRQAALMWGTVEGAATIATLDDEIITVDDFKTTLPNSGYEHIKGTDNLTVVVDIRGVQIHELASGLLKICPIPKVSDETKGSVFTFYGTAEDAELLRERSLIIKTAEGDVRECAVTGVEEASCTFDQGVEAYLITMDEEFDYSGFPHDDSEIEVYGNLIFATQGKTEKEKILGNGDQRQTFQTFKLPKAPLTYLLDSSATPPEVPEIEIYVDDRQWTYVSSLFGYGPEDEIFIVREDESGDSYVQFGDGKTGSRLPSGVDNIKAIYRSGNGASGELKEDTSVKASTRIDHLKKIYLPGLIEGGSEAETGDNAKEAAPGKIQSLGRLVSIQDYETEALSISGVAKVKARWGLPTGSNVPAVILTVLMENESGTSHSYIEEIMNEYNQDRGPERFAVIVEPGEYKYLTIGLDVGYDTTYQKENLDCAIREALGVFGDEGNGIDGSKGLFSSYMRKFREAEYRTRIQGIVQNIEGVSYVRVTSFDEVDVSDYETIESIILETEAEHNYKRIECEAQQLLAIYTKHLVVNFTEAKGAQ